MAQLKYYLCILASFLPVSVHAEMRLIQPLVDGQEFPTSGTTLNTLPIFQYFDDVMWYLYTIAVGFCTIWIVLAGTKLITSGSDSSKAGEAKTEIKEVLIAILVLTFGAFILRRLNDLFFV